MKNNTPEISVVMTVYNGERFIAEAVESILNQTFRNFELIIVDNCSQDRTCEMIENYRDERIRFIKNKENVGQTKALNIGIKQSRAALIARMDADDVSEVDRLAVQYEYLEKHPDITVVGSWCRDIDVNGKIIQNFKSPTDSLWINCCLLGSGDLTSWSISHPTVLIRRSALEGVGLYDEEDVGNGYPQDYALWIKMIEKYKFANIPRYLLQYRVLSKSESRSFENEALKHRSKLTMQRLRKCLPNFNENDLINLSLMLEYQPQSNKIAPDRLLDHFDQYFSRSICQEGGQALKNFYRDKMKIFYMPVLFRSHKVFTLWKVIQLLALNPVIIFDNMLYRKFIKAFLKTVMSGKQYKFITSKLLSYR